MKLKSHNIPYYLTICALFIPVIRHLLSFFRIDTYFLIVTFIITLPFLRPKTQYPLYYYFFIIIWLLILILHAVFKNNIVVFGYMQSFFYGICFYTIFKKNKAYKIEPQELLNNMYKIYGVLFITLIAELFINIMGKEKLMLDLFSRGDLGKGYQLLPSRLIEQVSGYVFSSLNSIFFGPQSGSMLTFLCLLFYNPFDNLLIIKNRIKFLVCLGLFLICYTMTVALIFMIFVCYFTFFSRHSSLNRPFYKLSLILILILFFGSSMLFSVFFYLLQADVALDFYLFKWTVSIIDMFNLGTEEFLFGIQSNMDIENFTISWELGLFQVIFLSGLMPVVFLLSLGIFLLVKLAKYRRSALLQISSTYRGLYQSARLSVFVFSIGLFSLIHYAAIFSTGFFQLIGFHIAVSFYCFDIMNRATGCIESHMVQAQDTRGRRVTFRSRIPVQPAKAHYSTD